MRAWWSSISASRSTARAAIRGRRTRSTAEIQAKGGRAIASTLSIAEAKNAETIVEAALAAFGRVDILINNAGILRDRMFHKMSHLDWFEVIKVNLDGAFNMARAVAGRIPQPE